VCLGFGGDGMFEALGPAFSHIQGETEPSPREAMTVRIWDAESTGSELAVPPWKPGDVRELGQVRGFNDARFSTVHDAVCGAITLVDRETKTAYFQIPSAAAVPWYERAAPLRAALQALTSSPESGLVHAGGIGTGGDGVLVAGPSGSGKSTLVAAALAEGLDLVGDDYLLLTLDSDPVAHAVHSTIKLSDETLGLLPGLADGVTIPAESVWAKNVVDPGRVGAGRLVPSLRVRAVLLPARSEGDPEIVRMSGASGLMALAPSTTFQLPPLDGHALAVLARLARSVPTFAIHTGDDPRRAAAAVRELLVAGV
jgi:hypothetical protein